jgi:hypothetical protein
MSFGQTHKGRASFLPDFYVDHVRKLNNPPIEKTVIIHKNLPRSKPVFRRQRSKSLDSGSKLPESLHGDKGAVKTNIFENDGGSDHKTPNISVDTSQLVSLSPEAAVGSGDTSILSRSPTMKNPLSITFNRLYQQNIGNLREHETHLVSKDKHRSSQRRFSLDMCGSGDGRLSNNDGEGSNHGPRLRTSATLNSPLTVTHPNSPHYLAPLKAQTHIQEGDKKHSHHCNVVASSDGDECGNGSDVKGGSSGTTNSALPRERDKPARRGLYRQRSRSLDSSAPIAIDQLSRLQQGTKSSAAASRRNPLERFAPKSGDGDQSSSSDRSASEREGHIGKGGRKTISVTERRVRGGEPSYLQSTAARNAAKSAGAGGEVARPSSTDKKASRVSELRRQTHNGGKGGTEKRKGKVGESDVAEEVRRKWARTAWQRAVKRVAFIIRFMDANSAVFANEESEELPPPVLVFTSPKLFWRIHCSTLINVYEHIGQDCFEVIIQDVDGKRLFMPVYVRPSEVLSFKRDDFDKMLRVIAENRPDLMDRAERTCIAEFIVEKIEVIRNKTTTNDDNEEMVCVELKRFNGEMCPDLVVYDYKCSPFISMCVKNMCVMLYACFMSADDIRDYEVISIDKPSLLVAVPPPSLHCAASVVATTSSREKKQ